MVERGDDRTRGALIRGVLETVFEQGLAPVTMEGAARRAVVAKTTVYRRAGRDAMVVEASGTVYTDFHPPDTGDVCGDLRQLVTELGGFFLAQPGVPGAARLILAMASDRRYWQAAMEPRRQLVLAVLERGQALAEIRRDVDLDLAVDLILGAFVLAVLGQRRSMDRAFVQQVVQPALAGIACPLTLPVDPAEHPSAVSPTQVRS